MAGLKHSSAPDMKERKHICDASKDAKGGKQKLLKGDDEYWFTQGEENTT